MKQINKSDGICTNNDDIVVAHVSVGVFVQSETASFK